MGRWSTGAVTAEGALRIELSYLLKQGHIQKDWECSCSLSWTSGSSIRLKSCYYDNEAYIRLIYTNTNSYTDEVTDFDYKIQLTTIPSNLGKGNILYFVCPETGRKCRVLYKCYGSKIWKSRFAYRNRIYYESQIESKMARQYKYLFYDRVLEELYMKQKKSHYQGKPTRIMKKIDELSRKQDLLLSRSIYKF